MCKCAGLTPPPTPCHEAAAGSGRSEHRKRSNHPQREARKLHPPPSFPASAGPIPRSPSPNPGTSPQDSPNPRSTPEVKPPQGEAQRHSMARSGSGIGPEQAQEAIKPPPARSAKTPFSPELPCERRTDPAEPQPRSTPKHSHQVPAPHHPRITKSDPFCVNVRD